MAFIVTARKWRPQLFDEVVGQAHITTTLKNAIENDRVGHAYIFAGPRGVGKTTTARILAKRLNCISPNGGEPCDKCDACKNFLKSQSLDIIEIDGASNRRIDEIRTLRESVKYAPTSGKYKVYIIDEVHMLTTESFNALLKTLEEPPEHTIFIFATTDIHKVPLTIISRCQRFDFRRIEHYEIKLLLAKIAKEEKIKIDDESLTLIAKKADGALRDAESIFDQIVSFCGTDVDVKILRQMLNLIDDEIYFDISEAISDKNFKTVYEVSEKLYSNGWNFIDFINGLVEHFRNIMTVVVTETADLIEASESYKKRYIALYDKFSESDLLRILSFLTKVQNELRFSQNQKLKIEISLSHLIGLAQSSTITDLISKLGNSETGTVKKKLHEIKPTEIPKAESIETTATFKIDYPKKKPSQQKEITSEKTTVDTKKEVPQKGETLKKEPQENKSPIKSESSDLAEVKAKAASIDTIKQNWSFFTKDVVKEKFLLESITSSLPTKIDNNKLVVEVAHKADVEVLNNYKSYLDKKLNDTFKIKLSIKFIEGSLIEQNVQIEAQENVTTEKDDTLNKHPVIKAIVKELGGREIK
ncbi:MAG: DNA polymerase III subunit gamma/tau [Ignavibacteriae bacterium]|nr:DNA polymerase III subunit gamma/tau [Ignavibacteriota bacterium]